MTSLKPVKSRILEKDVNDGAEWEIPAKRGVGCLMIFGVLFCVPPLLILLASIFGGGRVESSSVWGMMVGFLFLCVFFMAGGAVAYFGYKSRYTDIEVRVREGGVEVVRRFSKGVERDILRRGEVFGVGLYKCSETNNKPNYGLLVKAREGAGIKFGVGLKEDELRWFASEMLWSLSEQGGLPEAEEMEAMYFSAAGGGKGEFVRGGVRVCSDAGGQVVIEKDGSKTGKGMLLGGVCGMLFGGVFAAVGFGSEDAGLIFGIVGSVVLMGGLGVFIFGLTKLGTAEKYTFEGDQVLKEKLKGGVVLYTIKFPKSDFDRLEVKSSGSSNDEERYSVVLKGGSMKLKLFGWVEAEVSEAVKYKVNGWLRDEVVRGSSTVESGPVSGGYGGSMVVEKGMGDLGGGRGPEEGFTAGEIPVYSSTTDLTEVKGGIWIVRVFLGVFLAVGLGLIFSGISEMMTAKDSESWTSVEGVVLKSKVSVDSGGDGTSYGADVSYRYKVNGKRYTGDKVTVSELSTSSRGRAQKIVKRYPKKKKVRVYYDAKAPGTSVLEKGVSGGSWLMPGVGAMFLIIPLIMLIMVEKSYRKSRGEELAKTGSHAAGSVQSRYGKM